MSTCTLTSSLTESLSNRGHRVSGSFQAVNTSVQSVTSGPPEQCSRSALRGVLEGQGPDSPPLPRKTAEPRSAKFAADRPSSSPGPQPPHLSDQAAACSTLSESNRRSGYEGGAHLHSEAAAPVGTLRLRDQRPPLGARADLILAAYCGALFDGPREMQLVVVVSREAIAGRWGDWVWRYRPWLRRRPCVRCSTSSRQSSRR